MIEETLRTVQASKQDHDVAFPFEVVNTDISYTYPRPFVLTLGLTLRTDQYLPCSLKSFFPPSSRRFSYSVLTLYVLLMSKGEHRDAGSVYGLDGE